jgi:uncharacterized SAM-dependent methyltransferase
MQYYKNTELAKLYNVSEKSVRNWIDATRDGKLDLTLIDENGHSFIANTTKNITIITDLVDKGKKFRNTRGYKIIKPTPEFFEMYDAAQVYDIISTIDTYKEIPHKYSYFDGGAQHWDSYTHKLVTETSPNLLTNSIDLLRLSMPYLDRLTDEFDNINIIDVGVGNALPVRNLVNHLIEQNKLGRYIGLDVSKDMLDIARHNLELWFGDKITFEGYVCDFSHQRFRDLYLPQVFAEDETSTLNLHLFLGGTIANLRRPDRTLSTIHDSMSKDDILISTMKLDTPATRRYFDFSAGSDAPALDLQEKNILNLLNIDETLYSVEQRFDEKLLERRIQVRFNVAVCIEFELDGRTKTVEINKDDSVLLWRSKHRNLLQMLQLFDQNDFETMQTIRTKNLECLLIMSKVRVNASN